MSISKTDVNKIAQLAKLELTDQEREKFTTQLNDIITYVEKLNELDTTGIKPLAHVNDLQNISREDESRPSMDSADVFRNSPQSGDGFFLVPKVLKT